MRILRRDRVKLRYSGCSTCVVAAILIFRHELYGKDTEPAKPILTERDLLPGTAEDHYEVSEKEEHIVSHVISELEKLTSRDNIQIELVDCDLRLNYTFI